MNSLDAPVEDAGTAGSTSHTKSNDIPDYDSQLADLICNVRADNFDEWASALAETLSAANDANSSALATDERPAIPSVGQSLFEFMSAAETNPFFRSYIISNHATQSPLEGVTIWDLALDPTGAFRLRPVDVTLEAVGVNPWDVVVDPTKALWPRECEGSPPVGGADASSESIGSASSADVDVPGPVGEEPDGDSEPPFLLEEPSGRPNDYVPTPVQSGLDGGGDQVEEEADEPGTSCAEQAVASHAQAARPKRRAAAASSEDPCAGLKGRNEKARSQHLDKLIKEAKKKGADARKAGLPFMSTVEKTYKCEECHKTGRPDRLLAHILVKHLGLRTWKCPICEKDYASRGELAAHLEATKVFCLCGKYITRTNWYTHKKGCEKCTRYDDSTLKLHKGRPVVLERQQPAPAARKRKAPERESGGDERKTKRAKRKCT